MVAVRVSDTVYSYGVFVDPFDDGAVFVTHEHSVVFKALITRFQAVICSIR